MSEASHGGKGDRDRTDFVKYQAAEFWAARERRMEKLERGADAEIRHASLRGYGAAVVPK